MNWREFEDRLVPLKWSHGELAARLGLHRNTVTKWKMDDEVPKYAVAYVEVVLDLKRMTERLLAKRG
jgi:hypothetical protein